MNYKVFGFKAVVATAMVTGVMSVSASAQAFSIGDTLQFTSNDVVAYDLTTGAQTLNFGNNAFDPTGAPGSLGSIFVTSFSTGAFAPYVFNNGSIKDLSLTPPTPTPIANFIRIGADLSFELTGFNFSVIPVTSGFSILGNGVSGIFRNATGENIAEGLITAQIFGTSPTGVSSYSGTIVVTNVIPTPALLPGLLALGAGILRKRKEVESEATES